MDKENLFELITKDAILFKEQGYAFYYCDSNNLIEKVNGKLSFSNSENITFDTHFRLASVSKQFVAMGIIKLVEQGLITYQTSILNIYPELPDYFNEITIYQLLNHTSGILDYEDMPHLDDDPQIKDEEIIPFLKTTSSTYFKPGSKYQYSNTAYILLGQIIEKITHQMIDKYLEKEVFLPFGLTNTLANHEGITYISNRAYGHVLVNDKVSMKDQYWCSATIGDGGIYSTINELNKWIDGLVKNEDKLKNTMFNPHILPDETNTEYGMGMRIINVLGHNIYYHCGDTIGTNTIILFSPSLKLRLIFLTNFGPVDTTIIKDNLVNYLKDNIEMYN